LVRFSFNCITFLYRISNVIFLVMFLFCFVGLCILFYIYMYIVYLFYQNKYTRPSLKIQWLLPIATYTIYICTVTYNIVHLFISVFNYMCVCQSWLFICIFIINIFSIYGNDINILQILKINNSLKRCTFKGALTFFVIFHKYIT
jgi:hypothetical protein